MNTSKILFPTLGLTGRVKAFVINEGRTILETPWQRNLWLDQGLNQIAETAICACFDYAAKGTGTTDTSEVPAGSNTYSMTNGDQTVTRTAGTRDFTALDVGKLIKFSGGQEFTIQVFTDATHVEVTPPASGALTNVTIGHIYHVQQVGLDAEVGRTNHYSQTAGENKTVTAVNLRTFTRTFLFDNENTLVERPVNSNTYSQAGTTVTRQSGTRNFTVNDVGSTLTFVDTGEDALITAFIGATSVTVDTTQTVQAQPIRLEKPNSTLTETPAGTNTYSRSGTTVTRTAGTRDFTSNDVGKYIYFITDNVQAKITVFTNATTVTVDVSGALAAQNIRLYGFTDYNEVGFSHSDETGDTLNIRVKLASAVRCYVSTPLRASDQLKLTYECTLTVTPHTATTQSLASIINDPGNDMSGNKNGKWAIESFATSVVATDGDTDISFPDLEPFYSGYGALSQNTNALAPLSNQVRNTAVVHVEMEADIYTAGSFLRTYQALFGLNDAIGTAWRSLMIYDPDSENAIFTFLYDANQRKDGEHTFQVGFQKAWGRTLA